MSIPESPTETLEPSDLGLPTQPTYCNLGEVRAHLLPSKACRPGTPGSLSSNSQPPPLPKKTLTRTQSLPALGVPGARAAQPQGPLLGSHSVNETQAEAGPAGPAAELTSGNDEAAAAALGFRLCRPHSPEALHAALAARELQGLRAVHARLGARLTGSLPGPCNAGHGFRLLELVPCAESGNALYYRVVRASDDAWHVLAAKVPKPGAEEPHAWGLELQASLPPHYNVQGLCGLVPEGALPGAPWTGRVVLAAEVPERTVAQWLAELGERRLEELAQAVALTLLQLSGALEVLEERGAVVTELRPENLLLAAPRGCAAAGPQRLLLADFGRVRRCPPGPPGAHAPQLGLLLRALLGPAAPPASPLASGLWRLAAQLPRARPSAAQTRGALQALLWGPGPELRGRGAALGPWLRVRRALLLVHLAERAAGGDAPGLEEWLCCEYLAQATEASLAHALELLWADLK
ncbi:protein PEAK3 [Erethizon dorsatum]